MAHLESSVPIRTNGDGMENPDALEEMTSLLTIKTGRLSLGEKFIYRPQENLDNFTIPPVIPTGEMVYLIPKAVKSSTNKTNVPKNMRGREPKFVPYEPYKAAVNPIIPTAKKERTIKKYPIHSTTSSISEIPTTASVDCANIDVTRGDCQEVCFNWEKQQSLIAELEALRIQNQDLEKQLKYQGQVNCELKSMLVAAVGEDVEVRVQHLTEDKLHLARALLSSSDNLSSHQEHLEWLAGQCEVWRSKFLASSLMVEELARWKSALQQRGCQLHTTLQQLLGERGSVRQSMISTLRNLQVLRENFDPASGLSLASSPRRRASASSTTGLLASSNVVDVSGANLHLSECLAQRLLGTSTTTARDTGLEALDPTTPAEKKALKLLQSAAFTALGHVPDAACSAVVGAAVAAGGGLFPHLGSTPTSCCAHCSGDMKIL